MKAAENAKKIKMNKDLPFKNVVVVGGPKCATMHIADFFLNSENFTVVEKSPDVPNESYDKIFRISPRGWKYKFCKTPGWIFNRPKLNQICNFIKNYGKQTLVIVCIREFNQLLKSWYEMRKCESTEYANKTLIEFSQMKSWENRKMSYYDCICELESNIIYLIKLLKNVKCAKLVVIDQCYFIENSTKDIFLEMGVDVINNDYQYEKPKINTSKNISDIKLFQKYKDLIENKTIQNYMDSKCCLEIKNKYF